MTPPLSVRHLDQSRPTETPSARLWRGAAPPPALAAVAVLQAILFAGSPLLAGFYGFKAWGLLSVVLFVALVAILLCAPITLSRTGCAALGGLVALTAWSALSMTWAESADRAWTETNRFALYAAILATVVLTIRSVAAARLVVAALAVSVATLVIGLAAYLTATGGATLFLDHRLNEPLGYVNGLAGFLVIGAWALVAAAESRGPVPIRAAALATAVLTADLLVLTQSRAILPALAISAVVVFAFVPGRRIRGWSLMVVAGGVVPALPGLLDVYASRLNDAASLPALVQSSMATAWLGAVAAGGVWAAICALGPRLPARVTALATPGLIILVLLITVAAAASVERPLERARAEYQDFKSLEFDAQRDSRFTSAGGNRYDLWRIAVKQMTAEPIRGVGAGGFATTYYLDRQSPDDEVRQPHSLPLQVLAELGIVGGLALFTFLAAVLWAGVRPGPSAIPARDGFVHVAALGGFVAWLAHTSVDWLHNLPGVTGIALIGGALLLTTSATGDRTAAPGGVRGRRLAAALAVLLVLIAAASTARQLAALHQRDTAAALLADNPTLALASAHRSIALNAEALETHYVAAAAHARLGDYHAARNTLLQAAQKEPHNHVPWALLGDLATRRGDRRLAHQAYRRAGNLNPRDATLAQRGTQ